MSLIVLTAANSRRLCSVMSVLDEMAENVQLIEHFIDQASAAIERTCGRVFAQQKYRQILPRQRESLLALQRTPVVAVTALSGDGEAITDYRIESADAGFLYRLDGWWLSAGGEWEVDYVAGFICPEQSNSSDPSGPRLPEDLQRAAIECVKIWWSEQQISDRIASKTFGLTGDRVEFRISANREALPPLAAKLIAPWRRWVLA